MVAPSTPDPTDALQQELAQLRQRTIQLEQQLATTQADRLQLQLQLEQRTTDLHRNETRLQTIANSIPGTIFQFSTQGQDWKMDYISDRVADLTGLTATEIMADMSRLSHCTHPDDRHFYFHSLFKAVSTQSPWHYEGRIIKPNGDLVWCQGEATPVKSSDDRSVFYGVMLDITDRKQAEAALEESRRFLHLVLDALPNQHILWKDRNSIYLGCNQLGAEVAGIGSPQDIIGKTDYDLAWTPQESDFFRLCDRRVMDANRAELSIIEPQRQASGKQAWLETNKVPLQDASGNVIGILVAFQDITERQIALRERNHAQSQLQEQEQFLRSIYDGVDYSIFALEVFFDRTVRYLGMNAVAERAMGITLKDYLGKTPEQVLSPEVAALSKQRFATCLETGTSHTWEDYLPFREEAWWTTTLTPLEDETGNIHRIVGTSINTTDRRRAEAQLREQEQFLRSIYDGVACFIFVVAVQENGDFVYLSYNKASEELTGLKSADIAGKTPEERFGQQEGASVRQGFQECVAAATAVTCEDFLTLGERPSWFLTTLNPIKSQNGRIDRIVGTAFDVTELKQAQTQLQKQATDLEAALQELQRTQFQMVQTEKMSSLGQLVAGVAHEINNPVNFIFGNLSHANSYTQDLLNLLKLYRKHYPNPNREVQEEAKAIDLEFLVEDLPKLLNSMKIGADRIQKIVASLRTFSRMDESEKKAIDVHEGIDSTLMILQNRIKSRPDRPEIQIVKIYGKLPLVECYAGQLNQVFMNLLSNAIDAVEEAGIPDPTLTVQTRITSSNQLQVSIVDNGIGIPEGVRSRLFDPFFTTKPVGKGTGMGLSISYQIVTEKHSGSLKCLSQPGEGATFVITIPLKLT